MYEEQPQPELLHCFGCSREFTATTLFLCLESRECIENRGPMCVDCLDAHTITTHEQPRQPSIYAASIWLH